MLLSKVKAKSGILYIEELVAECPNWHIFSSIVVRAKNPPKGHIYEVSLILLNSSGRNTDKPSRAYTSTPISQPTLQSVKESEDSRMNVQAMGPIIIIK